MAPQDQIHHDGILDYIGRRGNKDSSLANRAFLHGIDCGFGSRYPPGSTPKTDGLSAANLSAPTSRSLQLIAIQGCIFLSLFKEHIPNQRRIKTRMPFSIYSNFMATSHSARGYKNYTSLYPTKGFAPFGNVTLNTNIWLFTLKPDSSS